MNGVSTGRLLLRIAQAWTDDSVLPRVRDAGARALMAAAAIVLAAVLVLAALGCALTALWLYLLPLVGPAAAPLIVSGVLLSLGLVVLLLPRLGARQSPPPPVAAPGPTPDILIAEASRLVRDNKVPVLLSALLVGLCEGARKK